MPAVCAYDPDHRDYPPVTAIIAGLRVWPPAARVKRWSLCGHPEHSEWCDGQAAGMDDWNIRPKGVVAIYVRSPYGRWMMTAHYSGCPSREYRRLAGIIRRAASG